VGLLFDGNNATVSHGDVPNVDGAHLSLAFWIFVIAATANDEWIAKPLSGATGWRLPVAGVATTAVFQIGGGTNINATFPASSIVPGSWQHYGIRYDGTQPSNVTKLRAWRNGIEQTLTYSVAVPATIGANALALKTGMTVAGRALSGTLAHLFAWAATLAPEEILQQMMMRRPVRTAGLSLWVPYDDGVAARDYSGNANHGTVTSAVQAAGPPIGYGG
jgi:Concanavalin A-like lectin/glucanases superfamily